MKINAAGNVGIITTSPSENLHVAGNIRFGDTSPAHIYTNSNELRLGVDNNNDNAASGITFYVDTAEKMRITSGGHLLVGKTSQDSTNTVGFEAKDDGLAVATTDGVRSLILNRKTSDGTIVDFRKDNSSRCIGTSTTDLFIGSGVSGLRFRKGGPQLMPWNTSTNSAYDNAIDIGKSDARWKDLYLSGGAYLGGTGRLTSWMTMKKGRLLYV